MYVCVCLCGCVSVQLQSHYDFLTEKLGAEISQTLCEGAANNPLIMKHLPTFEKDFFIYFDWDDDSDVRNSFLFQHGIHVCKSSACGLRGIHTCRFDRA